MMVGVAQENVSVGMAFLLGLLGFGSCLYLGSLGEAAKTAASCDEERAHIVRCSPGSGVLCVDASPTPTPIGTVLPFGAGTGATNLTSDVGKYMSSGTFAGELATIAPIPAEHPTPCPTPRDPHQLFNDCGPADWSHGFTLTWAQGYDCRIEYGARSVTCRPTGEAR